MVLNASGFEKKLMFMLGLLSTLQLIEVAGMTVFTNMILYMRQQEFTLMKPVS